MKAKNFPKDFDVTNITLPEGTDLDSPNIITGTYDAKHVPYRIYNTVWLAEDCIDKIADKVVQKLYAHKLAIETVPSVQPERLTDDDFETIRIHLNAFKEKLCNQHRWEEADEYQRIIDRFIAFASVQPNTTGTTTATTTDCISRQAAIDALGERPHLWTGGDYELGCANQYDLDKLAIETVPSVQEQRWIPVSEKMPNRQELVIVSCHDTLGDTSFDYTSSAWATTDGEYWIVDNEINSHVTAWMPLPEPYKGDK